MDRPTAVETLGAGSQDGARGQIFLQPRTRWDATMVSVSVLGAPLPRRDLRRARGAPSMLRRWVELSPRGGVPLPRTPTQTACPLPPQVLGRTPPRGSLYPGPGRYCLDGRFDRAHPQGWDPRGWMRGYLAPRGPGHDPPSPPAAAPSELPLGPPGSAPPRPPPGSPSPARWTAPSPQRSPSSPSPTPPPNSLALPPHPSPSPTQCRSPSSSMRTSLSPRWPTRTPGEARANCSSEAPSRRSRSP